MYVASELMIFAQSVKSCQLKPLRASIHMHSENLVRLKARFLFYKGTSVPCDLRRLEKFLIILALETQSLATHFLHMYMFLILFFSFVVEFPGGWHRSLKGPQPPKDLHLCQNWVLSLGPVLHVFCCCCCKENRKDKTSN